MITLEGIIHLLRGNGLSCQLMVLGFQLRVTLIPDCGRSYCIQLCIPLTCSWVIYLGQFRISIHLHCSTALSLCQLLLFWVLLWGLLWVCSKGASYSSYGLLSGHLRLKIVSRIYIIFSDMNRHNKTSIIYTYLFEIP